MVTPESDATLWNIEAKQCSHSAHPVGVYPYKADWYNSNCDFEEEQVTLTKSGSRIIRALSLDFDKYGQRSYMGMCVCFISQLKMETRCIFILFYIIFDNIFNE